MGCHLTILLPRLALHSLPFHRYSTMKVSHFIFLGHSPNVTSSTEPLMNVAWELSILSPGLSNPLVECSPKLPKSHKAWTVEHPGSKRKRCHPYFPHQSNPCKGLLTKVVLCGSKYTKGLPTGLPLQRHSSGRVCCCDRASEPHSHLFLPPADVVKGRAAISSILRVTRSCGGRSRGGKTNVRILG